MIDEDDLKYRSFQRNLPPLQHVAQGQNSTRNNIQQCLRQSRSVQPGNELRRVLRAGSVFIVEGGTD